MAITFDQFRTNVETWAADRGIYEHSTALAQALKACSETGELCDAVIKNDREAMIDAIGDVAVCLINVSFMKNENVHIHITRNATSKPAEVVAASVSKTISDLALMVGVDQASGYCPNEIGAYGDICNQIGYALGHLSMISKEYDLDFMDCCEAAWEQIKDRKGRMVPGGAFVKE